METIQDSLLTDFNCKYFVAEVILGKNVIVKKLSKLMRY